MDSRFALRLLGSPQVSLAGQVLRGFESRKALVLLCYLALHAQPLARSTLADLFWGDKAEAQGRANLSRVLHNLNSLCPNALTASRDAIGVIPAAFQLDTQEFDTLSQSTTVEALTAAMHLYQDEFMTGIFLDDCPDVEVWLVGEREHWRQRAVGVLDQIVRYHDTQGESDRALAYAARALELEPWREETHRKMMDLLARTGQRNAALQQYETARRVLKEDLGVDPGPETRALYERVQAMPVPVPSAAPRRNLPVQLTSFIGRETELARLTARLNNPDCRLLTLTGPGGIGKTRLAIEAAKNVTGSFSDGVYFVPLASHGIGQTELIVPTIASTLGLTQVELDPKRQLLKYLEARRLLLVLDNFEHLLEGADLTSEILHHAPEVKLLVTSREPLSVEAEWLTQVQGLDYPMGGIAAEEDVTRYSAVHLFGERASRVNESFVLNSSTIPPVLRICKITEGMPLAIELAAAASKTMALPTIAERIATNLDELMIAPRAIETRHQSLRAVLDWSYGLLSEQEQVLFRRLVVFAGGWTLAAAEAICTDEQVSENRVGALMSRLLDKSLVLKQDIEEQTRYRMLEPVRQYAMVLFSDTAEVQRVRSRHVEYFAQLKEVFEPNEKRSEAPRWRTGLEPETNNFRAALEWVQDKRKSDPEQQAKLERRLGDALHQRGEHAQAVAHYFRALECLGNHSPHNAGN